MTSPEDLKYSMYKEMDIIQGIINRMANNSFLIKGWAISLISVTLLLKGTNMQAFIAFLPLVTMWYLDAYFLRQERLYRALYDWVINNRLNTDEYLFSMNVSRFSKDVDSICKVMMSKTLKPFYSSIAVVAIVYIIILFINS